MSVIKTQSLGLASASSRIPLPRYATPTVFVSFADGSVDVVDTVAVERAVRGHRSGWTLTAAEIQFAAPFMFDLVPYSVVCSRLGISADRLKKLFPIQARPFRESAARTGERSKGPAVCGTPRGYRAHRRRGEVTCQPCRDANAQKDREYRNRQLNRSLSGVAA